MNEIGLFGGSFNPPHLGHLALARAARRELGLAEVRWLPAGQPWQKNPADMAPAHHRAAMVAALIAGEPGMVRDDIELRRSGPSYTIDTVEALAAAAPGVRWWLILGEDQHARLATWHRAPELLARVQLAVAARGGIAPHGVRTLAMPRLDVSATAIRAAVARGEDVAPLTGPAVARYIEEHHLYRG